MQAILLSGGFGTRMRPLTYTTPKPLLPLLNKSLVQHIIDSLPKEVKEVVLAANYKIDMLREYFEDVNLDREVHIVDEPEPRGTAGAVKNVESYVDDTFFVINSDIISSLDFRNYLDFYREKDGIGAISAWRVDDPTEFGVMDISKDSRIKRFQEKPAPEEAFSRKVNAGHYILEPEVFDRIPEGEKVSMEREIFPDLVEEGLFGYEFEGYWIDCGRPSSLFEAHRTLLDEMGKKRLVGDKSSIEGELGEYVTVGKDCRIGKSSIYNSMIYDGVEIGKGCIIEDSILGYDVVVEDNVTIKDSIISDNLYLEKNKEVIKEKFEPEEKEI
ncbi:MAG: NDP-sugar synthase [Candidatus Thermoplasmatota archaeon]|nr:NDP-sugar synthase [Candidatus Thermoplasmatota archaeon]MBS3789472.1 NDP-sugar synthase [Candidatus Thermoplasmatota archaeon]